VNSRTNRIYEHGKTKSNTPHPSSISCSRSRQRLGTSSLSRPKLVPPTTRPLWAYRTLYRTRRRAPPWCLNQYNPGVSKPNHPDQTHESYQKLIAGGIEPRQLARQVGALRVSQRQKRVRMYHPDEQPTRTTTLCFGSLDFVFDGPVESPAEAVFSRSQPDMPAPP
jgi:hypothetical protein